MNDARAAQYQLDDIERMLDAPMHHFDKQFYCTFDGEVDFTRCSYSEFQHAKDAPKHANVRHKYTYELASETLFKLLEGHRDLLVENAKLRERVSSLSEYTFAHPDSGERQTVSINRDDIEQFMLDEIEDKITCGCQPIGETNVVECNCDEYYGEFELVETNDEDTRSLFERLERALVFPVALRKMWSGGDVQNFIDNALAAFRRELP